MKLFRRKGFDLLLSGILGVSLLSSALFCSAEEIEIVDQEPAAEEPAADGAMDAGQEAAGQDVEVQAEPEAEPAYEVQEEPADEVEIVIEAIEPVAEEEVPVEAPEADLEAWGSDEEDDADWEDLDAYDDELDEYDEDEELSEEEQESEEETEVSQEIQVIEAAVDSSTRGGVQIPAYITVPAGYDQYGSYPLVVMLHGHGGDHNEAGGYDEISNALAENDFLVVTMDFPGCGESSESFQLNTMTNMKADVVDVLSYVAQNYAVDPDRIGGFGYSMGGRLIMELTTEELADFAAVVLVAPAADNEDLKDMLGGADAWEDLKDEAQEFVCAEYTTIYGQVQELSYEWFTDLEAQENLTEEMAESYEGNSLVIWAYDDETVSPYVSENVADALGSAVINTYTDGHSYSFYGSDEYTLRVVNEAVENFFVNEIGDDGEEDWEELLESLLEEDALIEEEEEITGYVRMIDEDGSLWLTIPEEALTDQWFEYGDTVTVTVDEKSWQMPYCTSYEDVGEGEPLLLADDGALCITVRAGSFATEYGIAEQEMSEDGAVEYYYQIEVPAVVRISMTQ